MNFCQKPRRGSLDTNSIPDKRSNPRSRTTPITTLLRCAACSKFPLAGIMRGCNRAPSQRYQANILLGDRIEVHIIADLAERTAARAFKPTCAMKDIRASDKRVARIMRQRQRTAPAGEKPLLLLDRAACAAPDLVNQVQSGDTRSNLSRRHHLHTNGFWFFVPCGGARCFSWRVVS